MNPVLPTSLVPFLYTGTAGDIAINAGQVDFGLSGTFHTSFVATPRAILVTVLEPSSLVLAATGLGILACVAAASKRAAG